MRNCKGNRTVPEIRLRRPAARRNCRITVTYTRSSGEQFLQPGGDWEGEKRGYSGGGLGLYIEANREAFDGRD
jgi:hypothetical protein